MYGLPSALPSYGGISPSLLLYLPRLLFMDSSFFYAAHPFCFADVNDSFAALPHPWTLLLLDQAGLLVHEARSPVGVDALCRLQNPRHVLRRVDLSPARPLKSKYLYVR